MSDNTLNVALVTMSKLLQKADFESLARYFKLPLPFYEDGEVVIMSRRRQVAEAIQKYHNQTIAEGTVHFDPEIVEIERSSDVAQLCLIRWNHLGSQGEVLSHHDARYLFALGDLPGSFRIEVVECGHSVATRSCLPNKVLPYFNPQHVVAQLG